MPVVNLMTLSQEKFSVDVELSITIKDLKIAISHLNRDAYDADSLMLVYAGKVMDNAKTLKDYNYVNTSYIVVMGKNGKIDIKTKMNSTNQGQAPKPTVQETPRNKTQSGKDSKNSKVTVPEKVTDQNILESAFIELKSMGFPEDQVKYALRISNNKPDVAMEILLGNVIIPETELPGNIVDTYEDSSKNVSIQDTEETDEKIKQFIKHRNYRKLCTLLLQYPDLVLSILKELRNISRPLLFHILDEPDTFYNLVLNGFDVDIIDEIPKQDSSDIPIPFTKEDMESIVKLSNMGYPFKTVIQAYLAFYKDEEAAINFLKTYCSNLKK